MSKQQLARTIRKEIRDLNLQIDMKIVKGLSYRNEARRHKILLMQLDRISMNSSGSWLGKISAMANAFVF